MLLALAPIKWIAPIKTTRITASMIAYSPTPWPCSDRSLFKLKRPMLLASRKSLGSMFTFSLHRQEWPNSGNPKVTTTRLTTVIKKSIRLLRKDYAQNCIGILRAFEIRREHTFWPTRIPVYEPTYISGNDAGPNPDELLMAALGASANITAPMYAERKRRPIHRVGRF